MQGRGKRWFFIATSVTAAVVSMGVGGCDGCDLVEQHSIEVGPNPAKVGESVQVTTRIQMRSGNPNVVEWDLDGDGRLETSAAPTNDAIRRWHATTSRSYGDPTSIFISSVVMASEVTARGGAITEYDYAPRAILQIQPADPAANQPPLASFTIDPNPVAPEGTITYDASESMDPDGQIVRYEWDLDHNGSYETDTGSNPTTTHLDEGFPGEYTIGLRVTDDDDTTGTTTRQLIVQNPTPRLAQPGRLALRLGGAKSFEFPPKLHPVAPGELLVNGDDLIVQGRRDRGRLPAGAFPGPLRHGDRTVRWLSSVDATIDTVKDEGEGRGVALLSFPAGGRACMAFRVEVPSTGKSAASFRILGGVGRADGIRGRGAGEGRLTSDGVAVSGHLDVDLGGGKPFKLGRSDCAPLLRRASAGA